MTSCFSAYGTGAAFAIGSASTSSRPSRARSGGRLTIRLSWVGAENVFVTLCSFTASSHADRGRSGAARRSARRGVWLSETNASGPEWYIGPVVMCTSLPIWKPSSPRSANTIGAFVLVRSAPLGLPGGARRVEHLRADRRRVGRRRLLVGLAASTSSQAMKPVGQLGSARRWRRSRRTPAPSGSGPGPRRRAAA